eukprot:206188-Pelagomonas_calceolata.AAC.4
MRQSMHTAPCLGSSLLKRPGQGMRSRARTAAQAVVDVGSFLTAASCCPAYIYFYLLALCTFPATGLASLAAHAGSAAGDAPQVLDGHEGH